MPSTKRTQLQRVHITSECVRAESARKRTPRSRSPLETPVAATITSPGERSSVVKICSRSSSPYSRASSISLRVVGHSWACNSPPRQRSAAAAITAWRVPPIPIARWSLVPRIAAEIDAVTSPSWISLIRAPAARISSIRSWWRGRSRTIVVTSLTLRPKASAIPRMFSATGRRRSIAARARGPTASLRMYMSGKVCSEPGSPTAIMDIAPPPPRATTPRPSRGSSARSTCAPPPAPLAPSPARSSHRGSTGRVPSLRAAGSVWSPSSDLLELLGALEHELHRLRDRKLDVAVLDHGHARLLGPPDDVVLDLANVPERVEIPLERTRAARGGIAQPEVARVRLDIVDSEHELDDERPFDVSRDHADRK